MSAFEIDVLKFLVSFWLKFLYFSSFVKAGKFYDEEVSTIDIQKGAKYI